VHDLNRFEWNNIQTHAVAYLGSVVRVHLLVDIMDECPDPLEQFSVAHPNLCKYDRGDLTCRQPGEPEPPPETLASDEEFFISPLTGRKQTRKKKQKEL